MTRDDTATIYALASAPGPAGVAVYRVSGPLAREVFPMLCRRAPPPPRQAIRAALHDPVSGEALDDGLALWFPAPASFTGEDVVELHLHGGRAGMAVALDCLGRLSGLRLAEPGEFTKRAFINGKLDLTAAEGLADLVAAETEAQRRQARRQLAGELGALYDGWRARLLELLAYEEAAIDFADEDLPTDLVAASREKISALAAEIAAHLDDNRRGERLREGISVVILGAPNAGKSSLLNALAQRDVAIVSSRAGTTRDIVEVHLDLGGWPVVIADTAGLRETDDEIEEEGVRRARDRAQSADVKIVLLDGTAIPDQYTIDFIDSSALVVASKADLGPISKEVSKYEIIPISSKTGFGLPDLLKKLEIAVSARVNLSGPVGLTRVRHRNALESCRNSLGRALGQTEVALRAEDLRQAAHALGSITGKIGVEDLLDKIFRDFCIGK